MIKESLIDTIIREGDKKVFYHHGLKCEIIRMKMGFWCGYVHKNKNLTFDQDYNIHGGVTFDDKIKIGFDCAHCCDLVPSYDLRTFKMLFESQKYDIYRTKNFAIYETKRLADQIYFQNRLEKQEIKLKKATTK
jgi:hypothetical protein